MWVADSAAGKVYSYNMLPLVRSDDSSLSALTLSPTDISSFFPEVNPPGTHTRYEAGVASTVTQATITATANHYAATVAYSGTDADTTTTAHEIDLSAGRNVLTVTVTAQDGSTSDYEVSVNRGVIDYYSWKVVDDFTQQDLVYVRANDIWSDGTTMWILSPPSIYAYRMSDMTPDITKDFNTLLPGGNFFPRGIWSDGETMWVSGSVLGGGDYEATSKLFAYRMSDQTRDASKDFNTLLGAGNTLATQIWSDGETMWVFDVLNQKLYAYRMSDKIRDSIKDINFPLDPGSNGLPPLLAGEHQRAFWSDGTTLWVDRPLDDNIYAYRMSNRTRDASKDYTPPDYIWDGQEDQAYAMWSDGTTMWVSNLYAVRSFNMPPLNVGGDPAVSVRFEQAAYTVTEGGSVTVRVTLSSDPERTVEVPITVTPQGGATAADYSGVPDRVTFNAGETEQSFTFTAVQDTVDDDDESVRLAFGGLPARVTAGSAAASTVSITDQPLVTVSFGEAAYTAVEGSSVTVTVTLSADPERTVEVPITVTLLNGATAADYSGVPDRVTFNAGDTEQSFTFTAVQDTVDDDGESVELAFGTLPTGVTAGSAAASTVSITGQPLVTVSFERSAYAAAEGGSVTVTVTLSADPERTVEVPITVTLLNGATTADYSGVPDSVTFDSGDTEQSFTFTATDDTVDDDDGVVELTFGALPTGVTAGSTAASTVIITDDDDPRVEVSFEQSAYAVAEGGSVTVRVTLSADPERTVEIPLIRNNAGGATGADYSGVPDSVTFDSGETEQTFNFTATDDAEDDDDESVRLAFGALPARVTAGSIATGVVSILDDDDPAVTVSFEEPAYTVAEGDSATVRVTLSEDPERTVEIPLIRFNAGGATAADYSGVPDSVTFDSGETEQTFNFTATDDTEDDDDESVRLTFGALPARVTAGSSASTSSAILVIITDDDDPRVEVSFEQAAYTVAEGGSATVRVTLSADPERTVEIPLTRTNQDGARAPTTPCQPAWPSTPGRRSRASPSRRSRTRLTTTTRA